MPWDLTEKMLIKTANDRLYESVDHMISIFDKEPTLVERGSNKQVYFSKTSVESLTYILVYANFAFLMDLYRPLYDAELQLKLQARLKRCQMASHKDNDNFDIFVCAVTKPVSMHAVAKDISRSMLYTQVEGFYKYQGNYDHDRIYIGGDQRSIEWVRPNTLYGSILHDVTADIYFQTFETLADRYFSNPVAWNYNYERMCR